jgi:hypothetical protein
LRAVAGSRKGTVSMAVTVGCLGDIIPWQHPAEQSERLSTARGSIGGPNVPL